MKDRYIYAVASYFGGNRNDIFKQVEEELKDVSTEEELLSHGHPKTKAFEYGYTTRVKDYLNHHSLKVLNKVTYTIVNSYMLIMMVLMIIRLKVYNFNYKVAISSLDTNSIVDTLLNATIFVVLILVILYLVISIILTTKNDTQRPKEWNKEVLKKLPPAAYYHFRSTEVVLDYLVLAMVITFTIIFSDPRLIDKTLMFTIFFPYIVVMALDAIYSYKERFNSKSSNIKRIVMNFITLTGLTVYFINGTYLPMNFSSYTNIIALCLFASLVILNFYNIITNAIAYFKLMQE